jgi:hypothetical protein
MIELMSFVASHSELMRSRFCAHSVQRGLASSFVSLSYTRKILLSNAKVDASFFGMTSLSILMKRKILFFTVITFLACYLDKQRVY